MNFATAARQTAIETRTENGAYAHSTSGSACLDLFASIGSLRKADRSRIERLFSDAYAEEPLTALKTVFYARDIRGGLGERNTFRILLKYMAFSQPADLRQNLSLVPEYGRWDDMYALVGTPLEADMWALVKAQLEQDQEDMKKNRSVSLLVKWLKTADASSSNTRRIGIYTALHLGYSVYTYKRIVKSLRRYIDIVERKMSAGQWTDIRYETVPSKAMNVHRAAFARHDPEGIRQYILSLHTGERTIHADTLYPYDIAEKFLYGKPDDQEAALLDAQWKALPDYVGDGGSAMVIADVSGSMHGRPLATSVGLALYFAARNQGPFHNLAMTFSTNPSYIRVQGSTIGEQIRSAVTADWDCTTDLQAALDLVLHTAAENSVPQEQMPRALIIISDMEIDCACRGKTLFYDLEKKKFQDAGYQIPNIIFWNANARHDIYHADAKRKGVLLFSGQSVSTFRSVLDCIDLTPLQAMHKVLDAPRYNAVRLADKSL